MSPFRGPTDTTIHPEESSENMCDLGEIRKYA